MRAPPAVPIRPSASTRQVSAASALAAGVMTADARARRRATAPEPASQGTTASGSSFRIRPAPAQAARRAPSRTTAWPSSRSRGAPAGAEPYRDGVLHRIRVHFDRDCNLVRGDHFHRVSRCGHECGDDRGRSPCMRALRSRRAGRSAAPMSLTADPRRHPLAAGNDVATTQHRLLNEDNREARALVAHERLSYRTGSSGRKPTRKR